MNMLTFLTHAAVLEYEAKENYAYLAAAAASLDNTDVAVFLREMAGYAELHFQQILALAEIDSLDALPAIDYDWPDGEPPEVLRGSIVDLDSAMRLSLQAEQRAHAFYEHIANSSDDPVVIRLAHSFSAEENDHVTALERFMGVRAY